MNHYQAFLNWLKTHNISQTQFEAELALNRTNVSDFISKLGRAIANNESVRTLYVSTQYFFRFANSILGSRTWEQIFYPTDATPICTLLAPYYKTTVTNEEILALFLKKHRKFKSVKQKIRKYVIDAGRREVATVPLSHVFSDNNPLFLKWQTLVNQFSLTGEISPKQFLKIK